MNTPTRELGIESRISAQGRSSGGFALIVVMSMIALITLLVVGLLSLAANSQRSSYQGRAMEEAKANSRLGLMMALGELQKLAGPDQRITATAGILDASTDSASVEGVEHPHWLGAWNSWGTWLNASYDLPGGALTIQDTYVDAREPMFRRWLVSGLRPEDGSQLDTARQSNPFAEKPVPLVRAIDGDDSIETHAGLSVIRHGERITGGHAWWVSGENLKADISLNAPPARGSAAETEVGHGNAGTRRFAEIDGLHDMPRDTSAASKMISLGQAPLAGADPAAIQRHIHDFTAYSTGLLTDTRWGGLRKDLSLLFDRPTLPVSMRRSAVSARSPRPMSAELQAFNPRIPQRPFTSYEQFHSFARQFTALRPGRSTEFLDWSGSSPFTAATNIRVSDNPDGREYRRMPIIVKSYCIFNLQTERGPTPESHRYFLTYSPVVQLWNPYNTPLELPSGVLHSHTLPYKITSVQYRRVLQDAGRPRPQGNWTAINVSMMQEYSASVYTANSGSTIRFEPGEFILFSLKERRSGTSLSAAPLTPGFDPGAVGSIRAEIRFDPPPNARQRAGLAMRLRPHISSAGDIAIYQGGNPGSFCQQLGANLRTYSGVNIDWFGDRDGDFTVFAPDNGPDVAYWHTADSEPVPFAVYGVALKGSERLTYDSEQDDWRSRTWIHSPPAFDAEKMLAVYDNPRLLAKQRRSSSLQAHWRTVSGVAELGETIPHLGHSGFMGSGSTGSEKILAAPILELPSAPVQSLAGFAGMRLQPGWFNYMATLDDGRSVRSHISSSSANQAWRQKVGAYRSGVPGVGVGNSFASPMIPGDTVYAYHDISKINPESNDPPWHGLQEDLRDSHAFSDFWDHGLLVNDGLWDSYFVSSLMGSIRRSDTSAPRLPELLTQTFQERQPLPNANFQPMGVADPEQVITSLQHPDGYLQAARYLGNRGAFNVNSVSVDAWHAFLSSLKDHEATYRDGMGELRMITTPPGTAVVTRFNTETAGMESPDPRTGVEVNGLPSWTGVRFLDDAQLRQLAEKCVEQVKLRGPFLNFSDFVNRRLSNDAFGTRGALQAAIDFDDENPDPGSINYRFKSNPPTDMIAPDAPALLSARYPFPAAAAGSRFTGAPGYVVQSDLLRLLGNGIAVRDDTFRIRAYGETTDRNGRVIARAWCEAVVQRSIEYIDPGNEPTAEAVRLDANGNPSLNNQLSDINRQFGRRFHIVSFRWLSPEEI